MKYPDQDVNMIAGKLAGNRTPQCTTIPLAGKFDFELFCSTRRPDADDSAPDLATAVKE